MLLPQPLKPGDLLRVIAPSGCLRSHLPGGRSEIEAYRQGIEIWQQHGYRVEIALGCEDRWGYLAGTDAQRREQLRSAWCDESVRGILCARGGYGGSRLLEDWHWQGGTPKWLIGFSDITALLWNLNQQDIVGIHGAVLTSLGSEPQWSIQRLFDAVQGRPLAPLQGKGWGGGKVRGRLLAGNLTVATGLLGTAAQPSFKGTILALEDVGEAPYRIDRMLTQWRMMGAFEGVVGIALGRFSSCQANPNLPSFTVEEVLRDRLSGLNIPIVDDLPFGHEGVNAALPVGIEVELDGDSGLLSAID